MAGKDVATGEREIVTDADGEREWVGLGEIVGEVEGDRVIEEDGVGDRLMDAVGDEQGEGENVAGLEVGIGEAEAQGDEVKVKGGVEATGEIVAAMVREICKEADIFGVREKDVEGLGLELGLGQADGSTDMPVPQAAGHVQGIGVSVLNGQ